MRDGTRFNHCIQIAGVADQAEAKVLIDAGVGLLGFPLRLPVHEEDLSEAAARALIRQLPEGIDAVLITYLEAADEVAGFVDELGAPIVQLHGQIDDREVERLRRLRPELGIIRSLVVGRHEHTVLQSRVERLGPTVDAFITDTFDPATGADGATGKTHDWRLSRALVKLSARPVILAGGLTPDNVRRAILTVGPAGVDAHTGVEGPDGRKDAALVSRFVAEARAGFRALADRDA
jgi:phosphoribosylanthranilate isomerase